MKKELLNCVCVSACCQQISKTVISRVPCCVDSLPYYLKLPHAALVLLRLRLLPADVEDAPLIAHPGATLVQPTVRIFLPHGVVIGRIDGSDLTARSHRTVTDRQFGGSTNSVDTSEHFRSTPHDLTVIREGSSPSGRGVHRQGGEFT
eukprot:1175626-Prorocentrum_minimum.AAC.4